MSLAGFVMFFVWMSFVVMMIMGWLLMAIGNESNLIEDEFVEIELDEVDIDNVLWCCDDLGSDNTIELINKNKGSRVTDIQEGKQKW